MKKAWVMGALFALVVITGLAGCGNKAADDGKLFIYNWSYYIPEQVLRDFEKKFHVTIVYDVYSSNEEMYTKLKAGGKGYDLVFPSGDYVNIMVKENMAERLDRSKIPNLKYMDKNITKKITYDRDMNYSVPFVMGAAGIAVNKKYVKNYPRDYSIYERSDLKGKMILLDDMREVLGSALAMLGYSANTRNPAELEKAKELVLKWKKNVMKFDAETFAKGFASGEFWVVQGYLENIALEMDDSMKKDADLFIPVKGGTMYIDNMMVLKNAKHRDTAFAFINYIHEPEVYAKIADFLTLPSINTGARKFTTNKTIYSVEDMQGCEIKDDLGPALELYNKIWQEIRIEN